MSNETKTVTIEDVKILAVECAEEWMQQGAVVLGGDAVTREQLHAFNRAFESAFG